MKLFKFFEVLQNREGRAGRIETPMESAEDDEQLVERCKQGSQDAFEKLVNRHKRPIFNLAYRMTGDYEEAEDIAVEVFLRIYRTLARFKKGSKFVPWLYKIATNVCINSLKSHQGRLVSLNEETLKEQISDWSKNPEKLAESQQLREYIQRALLSLPEKYRIIVLLRHVEDLSYEEIAQATNLPLGSVKTLLFRAKEILKKKLKSFLGKSSGVT